MKRQAWRHGTTAWAAGLLLVASGAPAFAATDDPAGDKPAQEETCVDNGLGGQSCFEFRSNDTSVETPSGTTVYQGRSTFEATDEDSEGDVVAHGKSDSNGILVTRDGEHQVDRYGTHQKTEVEGNRCRYQTNSVVVKGEEKVSQEKNSC